MVLINHISELWQP